jgi:hypothetical protein
MASDARDLGLGTADQRECVTAVPRRSLNVTPTTPAFSRALPHEARNPSGVHGRLSVEARINGPTLCLAASSIATFSGAPTGITTVVPFGRRLVIVLRGRSRICVPS